MVKFGRHLQFFLDLEGLDDGQQNDSLTVHDIERNAAFHNYDKKSSTNNHYIVPYNALRDAIESTSFSSSLLLSSNVSHLTPATFEILWRDALSKANLDLSESMNTCWRSIFDSVSSYQHHHQQQEQYSKENSSPSNKNNNDHFSVTTRGMELMDAIQVYTQINDIVTSRDLLCFLKDTYNAAEMNYQALRKIVKKFDKKYHTIHDVYRINDHNQHYVNSYQDGEGMTYEDRNGHQNGIGNGCHRSIDMLSVFLLPELYSSFLFVGRGMLETTISYLRELIEELNSTSGVEDGDSEEQSTTLSSNDIDDEHDGILSNGTREMKRISTDDEDEDEDENQFIITKTGIDKKNKSLQSKQYSDNQKRLRSKLSFAQGPTERNAEEEEIVTKRADEMQWLNNIVKKIPQSELRHIVAHRGFHTSVGRSDFRPLENSLSAFEYAWSAGIHLCECDVALTKDEKLVLAHDEDFNRLALDRSSTSSNVKVSELTFKELIALTLKNGVRAPLLKDVLMSANAIGPEAKLLIEIKPGNSDTGMALARLLVKYPELMTHVAVIMSFDLWSMHSLCAELHRLFPTFNDVSAKDTTDPVRRPKSESLNVYGTSPSGHTFMNCAAERNRSNSLVVYDDIPSKVSLPKLMLLTVADQPGNRFELCVDVSDYSPIDGWLHSSYTSLDGVYVRCQPDMLLPEGKKALQDLSKKYAVGVWGKAGEDPDDYRMMHYLVKECGVSFYNTDLPRSF
jgi:glycerophosphoryl diester phosphodiesterase